MSGRPGRIRSIVIVGGGTAGWMAAAVLARTPGPAAVSITLVESDAIATVGVGEATIPPILMFNRLVGLDESAFLAATGGTFKLGIRFKNWWRRGESYSHAFGLFGASMNGIDFSHHWLRDRAEGGGHDRDAYSAEAQAMALGRFGRPDAGRDGQAPRINHAYHFDAGLYAALLRRTSEAAGVARVEGRVVDIVRDAGSGLIAGVVLDDGRSVEGDFFIDCSGFRALLIGGALGIGYEDWSNWLPANRAVAAPSPRLARLPPYTLASAFDAGWRWRIPLRHRTGNGLVFSDAFLDEDAAAHALAQQVPDAGEPSLLRFRTGLRRRQWSGNCLSLGLASGFLEPLESTGIHLVQAGLSKFLTLFPDRVPDQRTVDRYNSEMTSLFEGIRDFLVAHYVLTERDDSPFWREMRSRPLPDGLATRLASFRDLGELGIGPAELFRESNWFAVLAGQGVLPDRYHPIADAISRPMFEDRMAAIRAAVSRQVASLEDHDVWLERLVGR